MSLNLIRLFSERNNTMRRFVVLAALAALDPDVLSPREAQEALYHLKALLETVAPATDTLSS